VAWDAALARGLSHLTRAEATLGFQVGTTASLWLASDLRYVSRTLHVRQLLTLLPYLEGITI